VSEDEARGDAHEELQEEDARRVSHLQTAHRALLLPCEALQGEQVSGAVLSEHQAEAAAAEFGSTVSSGGFEGFVGADGCFSLQATRSSVQPTTRGSYEHPNGSDVESNAGNHRASDARWIQRGDESRCC
jgi:hypothetical protein